MDYKAEYYYAENDNASCTNSSGIKNQLENIKQSDRGYNKIWRNVVKNDRVKRTKIDVYTTSGLGNHIRDAETGEYYPYVVGSADEDLFFSVILATGEFKSKNGSNTLFYLSPEKYMSHLHIKNLNNDIILRWREKKENRIREKRLSKEKKINISSIVVK
jgi:hypothetical protein